ncbi:serine/threonine-protein kinase ATR-like [Anoplophora glabripennis]|uniref:serine/threonine-protein kinase ATR-like n=1 Tax=Anoplophora glabripennis TaxID=217634 RepID=UPI00087505CC|nr:serine/threonine-protein kinase ATR-like [Anoplophora glabripennis]
MTSYKFLNITYRKICAEAKLLIATYNDTISNVDVEVNLQNYREAVDAYKEWEKSLVCLAQYYDKIFQNYSEEDRDAKGSEIQLRMIHYFGKSLQYGSNYVYQSMPRLLSIWFDYGTRLLDVTISSIKDERKNTLLKMTKLIDSFLERLPAFAFLTAFSQLVSRICHPQREVYMELKSIIIKLLQQYPQQSLWMIISVIKSSYTFRSKRCADILCDPRLKTNTMVRLVKDFTSLAEKLIELCNKEIPTDVNSTKVSSLLRSLPRLLQKDDFSEIMMPTQKFRKLILPNPDFKSSQHNPFPNHYVHIVGIEDEVTILQSLQRPRKITLKGSDGKGYIYMLKPKDDLRKDFRLMEFNDIVNHLLAREPEARQRRLNIRLYSVAPLNEECGLIEWVPDLVGLRPILITLYKQRGSAMKAKELKEACCHIRDPLEKKRDVFTKKLLPRHPPVLGEWFRKTFPDAQSWLTARTAYIRTTAVMSMAGYILGLGDRHGENILLDATCGDSVHVDFNCLFNKGEAFDWPERVPFRLTHNMVSAMGPLGVEGIFRKSCACTLRVLRSNANTLMSIVTPFVYDPLVSWPRNMPPLQSVHNSEKTNEQAVDHIKNIELRLQGKVKTRNRTVVCPLSVEGQTNYLINEAISVDNLCQMYIGWGPYL